RQPHLPSRRIAGADQHRAERGDEAVLLGGDRVPAADADRRHLRNELPPFPRARLDLWLSPGTVADAGQRGRSLVVLPPQGMAVGAAAATLPMTPALGADG